MSRPYTIKDIYNYSKTDDLPMLSSYPADFWKTYRDNISYFDRLFMRKYTSFFPYAQDPEDYIDSVSDEFRTDVYAWLMINDKRYSELYRVNTIPDNEAYSLTNNYDLSETMQRTLTEDNEFIKGSMVINDNGSNIYGEQIITHDDQSEYGEQEIESTEDYSKGIQNNTSEDQVSAFNQGDYDPEHKRIDQEGSRSDRTENTQTLGGHTDNFNKEETRGAHTDTATNTRQEGSRTDTDAKDLVESTNLRRVGNMGVSTVDDMLQKHINTWEMFSFYDMIFSEIAREFLRC